MGSVTDFKGAAEHVCLAQNQLHALERDAEARFLAAEIEFKAARAHLERVRLVRENLLPVGHLLRREAGL